jgi:hypothetical protein
VFYIPILEFIISLLWILFNAGRILGKNVELF